jgi:hypothetical protein
VPARRQIDDDAAPDGVGAHVALLSRSRRAVQMEYEASESGQDLLWVAGLYLTYDYNDKTFTWLIDGKFSRFRTRQAAMSWAECVLDSQRDSQFFKKIRDACFVVTVSGQLEKKGWSCYLVDPRAPLDWDPVTELPAAD